MAPEYNKIEQYGLIGNLETCALVGRDGSLDWCCFPHLESLSVFAAIVDIDQGGHLHLRSCFDHARVVPAIHTQHLLYECAIVDDPPAFTAEVDQMMPERKGD